MENPTSSDTPEVEEPPQTDAQTIIDRAHRSFILTMGIDFSCGQNGGFPASTSHAAER
jgi:hypothetical protein